MVAGAGEFPGCPGAEAGLHPGQDRSLSQGHIKRQTAIHNQFRTPSWPHMHVFVLREEAGAPGENICTERPQVW